MRLAWSGVDALSVLMVMALVFAFVAWSSAQLLSGNKGQPS